MSQTAATHVSSACIATADTNPTTTASAPATLLGNIGFAVNDFAARKGAELTAATQPDLSVAQGHIASKVNEVHSVAQLHVASTREFVVAKADEAGQLVSDTKTDISNRASLVAAATTDSVTAARDHISNKTVEAVSMSRDSVIGIHNYITESITAARDHITSKSVEAVNVTRDSALASHSYISAKLAETASLPFAAGEYVATATTEQIEATKAAKLMLDEGGQDEEDRLLAKSASIDGVCLDTEALTNMAAAASSLRNAAVKLRKASTHASESREAAEFTRLAETYDERAAMMDAFFLTLGDSLEEPPITNKDSIAIGLLKAKLGYRSLFEPLQMSSSMTQKIEGNAVARADENQQADDVVPLPHEPARPDAQQIESMTQQIEGHVIVRADENHQVDDVAPAPHEPARAAAGSSGSVISV